MAEAVQARGLNERGGSGAASRRRVLRLPEGEVHARRRLSLQRRPRRRRRRRRRAGPRRARSEEGRPPVRPGRRARSVARPRGGSARAVAVARGREGRPVRSALIFDEKRLFKGENGVSRVGGFSGAGARTRGTDGETTRRSPERADRRARARGSLSARGPSARTRARVRPRAFSLAGARPYPLKTKWGASQLALLARSLRPRLLRPLRGYGLHRPLQRRVPRHRPDPFPERLRGLVQPSERLERVREHGDAVLGDVRLDPRRFAEA